MRGNFNRYYGKDNPHYKDGRKGTRLYRIYYNMITRCTNPKVRSYARYGGRGIKVCKEWADFSKFKQWALSHGYDNNLTIDRIDNDGDYEPSNCQWVTAREQSLNTSRNHNITLHGITKPLDDWSKHYGINPKTVRDRLRRGWEIERALTTPIDRRWSH